MTSSRRSEPCKIGYARVSTRDQSADLQISALRAEGCSTVFTDDGVSAARRSRPGLAQALRRLRPGDVLIVWKLDRAFRSASQALQVLDELNERDVHFVSLTERLDTRTAIGRLLYSLIAVFAEFERELIRERTRAGLEAARMRGSRVGRPPKLTSLQVEEARRRHAEDGLSYEAIGEGFGVSGITVSRAVNRARADSTVRETA